MKIATKFPTISLIMVAKNAAPYIGEAIGSVTNYFGHCLELIVVNDHSTDSTRYIVEQLAEADSRIKLFDNPGRGKVIGTSFGYAQSSGYFVKFIDADDTLDPKYFNELDNLSTDTTHCHGAFITDEKLVVITIYTPNAGIKTRSVNDYIPNLLTPPKWAWTIPRPIAERIFPIPEVLPFEDVWISVMVKKYSQDIKLSTKPMYYYRQHRDQTFGGILNYSRAATEFRAKRLLAYIDYFLEHPEFQEYCEGLENSRLFYELIVVSPSLWQILVAEVPYKKKLQLILLLKMNKVLPQLAVLKWKKERVFHRDT